jgi:hypothetical protein
MEYISVGEKRACQLANKSAMLFENQILFTMCIKPGAAPYFESD